MIPPVIHFVFGLRADFGNRAFSLVHYLAVVTAWEVNRPERIYFHYQYEPSGLWWERAKPYLTLNRVDAPDRIFGNRVEHFAHKADVIRLEQLIKHGGIYLDMDVICVNSLRPLLANQCVMAREPEAGLCNAVILAVPDSEFLKEWYSRYRNFHEVLWDEHSVKLPRRLACENPELITVLEHFAFFFPLYSDPPHALWMSRREALRDPDIRALLRKRVKSHAWKLARFKKRKALYPPLSRFMESQRSHFNRLRQSYCIHLWEQAWWTPYLNQLDPIYITQGQTNFARIIRHALRNSPALDELSALTASSMSQPA